MVKVTNRLLVFCGEEWMRGCQTDAIQGCHFRLNCA